MARRIAFRNDERNREGVQEEKCTAAVRTFVFLVPMISFE